ILLGLLPLASKGILGEVFATGITGSTGAGQRLQETTHFTWRANNISAYKTLTHQHLKEIRRTLQHADSTYDNAIHFGPWRGGFTRGIFVSSSVRRSLILDEAKDLYLTFYKDHPFTVVSDTTINLKQVV